MAELGSQVLKVRSKNAGPFWVTVDVFCGAQDVFDRLRGKLSAQVVADLYRLNAAQLKRFEIPSLHVLKFSFPRPVPQASPKDRDQHGAQYAALLEELDIDD